MFDELDTQPAEVRERALFAELPQQIDQAVSQCPGWARHLAGHSWSAVTDRESLQSLPVLRKSELMKAQQADPPFGGFVDPSRLNGQRVFMSPGPVWEPQVSGSDPWQAARALHAAGVRPGDRVHNALSYHMTPGGFILDEGARALGCVVFPAGVGGTESQVQAIRQLQAQVYVGTPDYLQVLLDHAAAEGKAIDTITRALVSGGALFPAMRQRYKEQGIHVQQCYATADLGVIAYECESEGQINPGMIVNEGLIVEILVPGTGIAVAQGQVGEVVVTRLHPDYPLLRFATGDLSACLPEPCPSGRTQMRLAGWMGRADQRVKVKGMFVDPVQLQGLPNALASLDKWRLVVTREGDQDHMQLQITLKPGADATERNPEEIERVMETALKSATNLGGSVRIVESLPNDGTVIDDQRDYEAG